MAKPIGHNKAAVDRVRSEDTKKLYADNIKCNSQLQYELIDQYIKDHFDTPPAALENVRELAMQNMKDAEVIIKS